MAYVVKTALIILVVAFFVNGQIFEKGSRKLEIEFVQLPPCPIAISTRSVTLDPDPASDRERIILQIENKAEVGIRAYAMVSGGNRYPTVHTWIFPTKPLDPATPVQRSVWPNRQEHYYFFFDYILYADGSVCGLNNHRRSIEIDSYLRARESVIGRLRELANDDNEEQLIDEIDRMAASGFFNYDRAGPPNGDTIKRMPQRAWEHVVTMLRAVKGNSSAAALANKLETEMPRETGARKGK